MSSGWLNSTRSFLQDLEDLRKKLSYCLEVMHFLLNRIDLMLLSRIILLTTWLEINLFPRRKWVIYGEKKKKTKRNERTELSLTSDSGVAKAEMFPHLKTNAKSCNKTHTQPFLHANILSPFKSLQLWIRTEALVFNKLPCLSCLAPRVSGYPSSQVTHGQINPTDTPVGRHVCSRCSERLFLAGNTSVTCLLPGIDDPTRVGLS